MKLNENYLKLQKSYLFTEISERVAKYQEKNPSSQIISLGIGDVTLPLVPAVIDAIHQATDEMGRKEGFHGYAPDFGYDFLKKKDYRRGL